MKAAVLLFFCALALAVSLGAAAPLLPLPGAAPTHFDLRQAHPQCIPPVREAGSWYPPFRLFIYLFIYCFVYFCPSNWATTLSFK
jgi:hypothetical protein